MRRTVIHFIDSAVFGGAEQALLDLLAEVDLAEWRPVLFHNGGEALRPLLDGALALGVEVEQVPVVRGAAGVFRIPRFAHRLRAYRPDIFHAHLPWPLACSGGILAAALARVPVVVATAQLYVDVPESALLALQRRLVRPRVHRYFAVSQATAESLVRGEGVAPERVQVVRNGVRLSRTPPATSTRNGGRPVVLTLARLDSQKGLDHLLDAAVHVPSAEFVLAGDGPERAALEARAARLGITDRVRFLGFRRDVAELLATCDVFVLPSLYEGLPLALLEAMAAERPVVATAIPGVNEVMAHNETGYLVPPADPAALAAALRHVLGDTDLARRIASGARERVVASFSAESVAAQVMGSYRELLRASDDHARH